MCKNIQAIEKAIGTDCILAKGVVPSIKPKANIR
jgi:hypothetical protein